MNYHTGKARQRPHSDAARRKMAVSAYDRQVEPAPITLPAPPWIEDYGRQDAALDVLAREGQRWDAGGE